MKNKIIYVVILLLLVLLLMIGYLGKDTKKFHGRKNTYQLLGYKQFNQLKEDQDIILVDVRSFLEYSTGHIEGAINIPLNSITESDDLTKLFPDKKAIYVFYCHSGNRSKTASELLLRAGYENIFDLGGIQDYPGPIVKDSTK